MKATEAAYFAGLIDGEGTVSFRKIPQSMSKRGWGWRPTLAIANSDDKMIKWVAAATGTGWQFCRHSYKGKHLPALTWRATSPANILPCLREALPYLVTKKGHALLLIEACELLQSLPRGKTARGYEDLFQALVPRLQVIFDQLGQMNIRGARWRV